MELKNIKVYFWMLLLKRGLKAPRRALRASKPSAGARRRGTKHPKLLVIIYCIVLECNMLYCTAL